MCLEDPDESDEENKCTMIVNLMQKGRRAMRDEGLDLLSVGFCIYALREAEPGRCTTDFFRYNASCARRWEKFTNIFSLIKIYFATVNHSSTCARCRGGSSGRPVTT